MNRNVMPIILIIIAVSVYYTFTKNKLEEVKAVKAVNEEYSQAIANSEKLVKVRDSVLKSYNEIPPADQDRLEKMLPDNVDNVRLIIDVNGVATRHGLTIKNVKTSTPSSGTSENTSSASLNSPNPMGNQSGGPVSGSVNQYTPPSSYGVVTLSFNVNSTYENFKSFLADLEASLRILEVSKITLKTGEGSQYDYGVELKTFWLKN